MLSSNPDFDVAGEAEDGRDAIRSVQKFKPDLVLMDLSMPKMDGLDAIREIKKQSPDTKILVLTVHKAEEYVFASLKAGAGDRGNLQDCLCPNIRPLPDNQQLIAYLREAIHFVIMEPDHLIGRMHGSGRVKVVLIGRPLRAIPGHRGGKHWRDTVIAASHRRERRCRVTQEQFWLFLFKRRLEQTHRRRRDMQPADVNCPCVESGKDVFGSRLVDPVTQEETGGVDTA